MERIEREKLKMEPQPKGSMYCHSHCLAALLKMPVERVIKEWGDRYLNHRDALASNKEEDNYLKMYGLNFDRECFHFRKQGFYLCTVKSLNNPKYNHGIIVEIAVDLYGDLQVKVHDPKAGSEDFWYGTEADYLQNRRNVVQLDMSKVFIDFFVDYISWFKMVPRYDSQEE